MKHIFIVNPISGGGKAGQFIPAIHKYFESNGGDYEVILTEKPKHATEIAARYHKDDNVILYACGGDGTIKEILDGVNPDVAIAPIPAGTGNDFRKSYDSRTLTAEQTIYEAINGEDVYIDYGVVNGTSKFMNVMSFGLDADINVYACDYLKVEKPNFPGDLVYAYATFMVGLHPQPIGATMNVDGREVTLDTLLISIANGKCYGGTFHPDPDGKWDDGQFSICTFRQMKTLRLINLIAKYLKGSHKTAKECRMFYGSHINLKFDRIVNVQIDGENSKIQEADIVLYPKGQRLWLPKGRVLK